MSESQGQGRQSLREIGIPSAAGFEDGEGDSIQGV